MFRDGLRHGAAVLGVPVKQTIKEVRRPLFAVFISESSIQLKGMQLEDGSERLATEAERCKNQDVQSAFWRRLRFKSWFEKRVFVLHGAGLALHFGHRGIK